MIPRERPKPEPKPIAAPPDPALTPPPETVDVVDYTFSTVAERFQITLTPADAFTECADEFLLRKGNETFHVFKSQTAWWSCRTRAVLVAAKPFVPSDGPTG